MTTYVRNLPHWHPAARSIFLTWRLYGSLPQPVLKTLSRLQDDPSKQFRAAETHLDKSAPGPLWLADSRIAAAVESVLLRGITLNHYRLHAWVIMPNHVHALVDPIVPVSRITNGLKGVSAHEANALLRRAGRPFWQDESFDHWIRNAAQFDRVRRYIENNPVKAGLAPHPSAFRFSSAYPRSAQPVAVL